MIRRILPALVAALVLLLLPLLLFAPVALGGRTLIPADALYLFEPYRSAADELGVGVPHNPLLADLVLENYAWKLFIRQAIQNHELPLWDPLIFAGHPFLANGQHSALYPLSFVYYLLPLWRAYGVFTWLQLGLAGWWAYLLARVLGVCRPGALMTGIVFQLSGFMLVSVVHPMIIAAASWLPFLLAMVELLIQQRPALGQRPSSLPWTLLGALGLGCQMLAGHGENTYFVLLVTAAYALWRLAVHGVTTRRFPLRPLAWLALLLVLGLALGAVQFIPLYEVTVGSFRAGETAATLEQVLGWAYPPRRLIAFLVPNFFGSPAHHSYFDLFQWRTVPFTSNAYGDPIISPDWDVKNAVEGGAYLGLLPLLLAIVAVWEGVRRSACSVSHLTSRFTPHVSRFTPHVSRFTHPAPRTPDHTPPLTTLFFTLLSLFSLGCIFGTPLYALVYALPFLRQSHSPFRWVFPLTLSVAVLAGMGMEVVRRRRGDADTRGRGDAETRGRGDAGTRGQGAIRDGRYAICDRRYAILGALALWGGLATLAGLALSRLFFAQIEPLVQRAFWSLALAANGFPDHRAFYSYEFQWLAIFGLLLTGTGIVLRLSRCPIFIRRRPLWEFLAVGLVVLDLAAFGAGFNPAVDRRLLEYTPPVVEFLQQDTSLWRYATFTPPGTSKTMNANTGMFYGLQTVAGYDSLFTRQYADYMGLIEPQDELLYNRIASFSEWSSLDSPLLDLLNIRYIVTEVEIPNPAKYRLVYQDEAVRVYENLGALPRAFTLPASAAVVTGDVAEAVQHYDVHRYVIVEDGSWRVEGGEAQPGSPIAQTVTHYGLNEVVVDAGVAEASWLVLGDSYFPGWRAFVRPQGTGEEAEQEVEIVRVDGNFRGVRLAAGAWTVRFRYSPDSVKIGAFVTFIAGMMVVFLAGLYLWRFFYREQDDASTVRRVAKNSIAPIVINLFNRAIEMAFAALMARILGPVGNGRYATAINIYLLFDIVANFGLDMYLMREVARDRARTRELFVNTTILRLLLYLGVAPLLGGFLAGRQALGDPLAGETVWATVLLYLGLLPQTVAYGLAALFRAYEKHEIPAAIQTVTTVLKVTLGVLVLVGGLGVVGLAGAAIVTNLATGAILVVLARRLIGNALLGGTGRVTWPLQRTMLAESWPLMAALLLQTLFTSLNLVLLQRLQGDAAVGWYDAARKWVDALVIVPSFFTFAVFPVMSRQAAQDRAGLLRSYRLSVKLLTMLTLPTALVVTLLATGLVGLLSGSQFLPYGATALRLLVWSIVCGWINSLTNYVLIALNRQRFVLLASAARVAFVIAANLLFVPRCGVVASALIIGGGELLLLALFAADMRRQLGSLGWGRLLGRTALAGLDMVVTAAAVSPLSVPLALVAGLVVYGAALFLLRALTADERAMLAPLLPVGWRRGDAVTR